MKKTTIFMAMAALMLASCAKNGTNDGLPAANDPNQISFNSSTGTTRATASGLTEVQGGFNVLGFKNGVTAVADAFIKGDDATATYQYTTNKWGWNTASGKEWPEVETDYPLTFYAEYPKVDMSTNTDLNKAIAIELSMAAQKDLLVAKSAVATRPANGFAPLNFKHILSNLVFQIETREGYTVHIQSIRVVNTAKDGRTFDYATMSYKDAEPVYTLANLATTDGTYKVGEGFFYNKNAGTPWNFTGAAGTTVGAVTTESGIMMQMPQMTIPYWIESNATDGLGIFKTDAAKWKAGTEADLVAKLDAWYTAAPTATPQPGMLAAEGWKGARIEVIYRIYDGANSKSVIGRQDGETYSVNGAAPAAIAGDRFVRVGFPLELSAIVPASVGWEMNKRYTYTIQLGTARATNGILLDPDYKQNDGESVAPKVEVENPKVDPGNPVTPGTINFEVKVDNWIDAGGIPIK